VLRPDKAGEANNHIWHWESGDQAATDAAMAATGHVSEDTIPRITWPR
jgi:carbon-monoxide dehydrogenase large subunit